MISKQYKERSNTMEVKDIFELRKQGKIEEAYNAIRPMYAAHKGHYTTIAMFWIGVDVMRLRYKQRRLEEAYKIFQSLLRLYPTMDDSSLSGQATLLRAAMFVFDHDTNFSILNFVLEWDIITKLTDDDWLMSESNGHPVQSLGMRIVGRVFKEVEGKPTVEMALKAAPILAEALKHSPYNLNNQRYKAMVYSIMGKRNKAINIYRHLLRTRHKSVLYKELSVLVVEQPLKIALLTRAIATQRDEKFRQRMRFQLANMLFNTHKPYAKYEIEKCISARKAAKYAITWEMQNLSNCLKEVSTASEIDHRAFYQAQAAIVEKYVKAIDIL